MGWRLLRRAALPLAVLTATTGCELPRFWMPEPATEQGERVLRLWQGSVVAALAVGAITAALLGWSVVAYRRRGDEVPEQTEYHVPIEIAYTALPLLVVLALFGFTYATQRAVLEPADDPLEIEVSGFKWGWRFHYPDGGVTTGAAADGVAEVVVPAGRPVRFRLASPDVVHSFFVPRFLFKRDVIPGRENEVDLTVTTEGTFQGYCAEFCGLDHAAMTFRVRAVGPAEFDRWLATAPREAP